MIIDINVPEDFNFWRTIYSHGWSALPPFSVDKDKRSLTRVLEFQDGKACRVEMSQPNRQSLHILTGSNKSYKTEIVAQLKSCLRIEEDFSSFYKEAGRHPGFRWVAKSGSGRLLRAPTVFEDVVKMICTTNCSWALTEIMVGNLCCKLGARIDAESWTFPSPGAIADRSEKFLRKEIRAGYRAPYLLDLSRKIAKGILDLEAWRISDLHTPELFKVVGSVKGVGPYAAGNILKLLGRYEYLGIDSWCRKQFTGMHCNGKQASDKVIEKHYQPFGKWKGLFFWMDMTKHWQDKEFPF